MATPRLVLAIGLAWGCLEGAAAKATFLWQAQAGRPTRIDTAAPGARAVEASVQARKLLPTADGGAWVQAEDELVRIAPDLGVAARVSLAGITALHWEPQGQRAWVAVGLDLLSFDEALSLERVVRLSAPIVALSASGPEAIWVATERQLVRVGGDGSQRAAIEWRALGFESPPHGLLADPGRARVWAIFDTHALDLAVAGSVSKHADRVLPAETQSVAMRPVDGALVASDGRSWRVVGDEARSAFGALGVLRPGDGSQSMAIAGPVVETQSRSKARSKAEASVAVEPFRLEVDDLELIATPARWTFLVEPSAHCGGETCERPGRLLATLRAELASTLTVALGAAVERDGVWQVEVEAPALPGPAVHPLTLTVVDDAGNRSAPHRVEIEVDERGDARIARINPQGTPVVSITGPANNAVYVAPASVTVTANASVSGATLTRVEFHRNGTLIGTDTTAPYSYGWSNVAAGTYALTAKAVDSAGGSATSAPVSITVKGNVAPSVALTAPAHNAVVLAPGAVAIAATASDSDGTISKVEFYAGATKLGTDTTSPYQLNWTGAAGGTYSLTAKAFDDKGAVTTSAARTVIVNSAPSTSLTAPANNAVLVAPVNVTLQANASDPDGSIAKVEFLRGTTVLATDTTSPYSHTWNSTPLGAHSLTARATDNRGAVTTSPLVSLTVNANSGPAVAMTAPAPGAAFTYPASIPMAATATDADGAVARVEFHYDYGLLASDTSNPYTASWNSPYTGTFTLSAKAVDNKGATTSSAPVTVTINANQPPNVVLTGDPPEGTISASGPPTFRLMASASDADGTVASVRFLRYDHELYEYVEIGADPAAPFELVYAAPDYVGDYLFRAEATDNGGAVGMAEISYTVVSNTAPQVALAEPGSTDFTAFVAPATVVLVVEAREFDLAPDRIERVEFSANATMMSSLSAPNGSQGEFVHVWRDVPAGEHQLLVRAFDTQGGVGQVTRSLRVVAAGALPSLAITQPVAGQVAGDPVALQVSATGGSSPILWVDLLNAQGLRIATWAAAPYTGSWIAPRAGRHALTAVAMLADGRAATSPTVFFDVAAPALKQAPVVVLTEPIRGSTVNADVPLLVAAEAAVSGATLSKVEFFHGTTLIGTAASAPYRVTWASPPVGVVSLTAKATDSTAPAVNSAATSAPINVTLASANPRPIVSLSAPLNGATFAAPATVSLAALASDAGGSITKVEFFAGSTLIATDTSAPYSQSWSNVGAGTYAITAKATDNLGAATVSSVATITISSNTLPSVTLTAPTAGQNFAQGVPVTLAASATDADGTVSKVSFFSNTIFLGQVTSAPYTFAWTPSTPGAHSVVAQATDNLGGIRTSVAVPITVTANALPTATLHLPRNGQQFAAGAPIQFVVTASDTDGSIARVEFVANGSLVGAAMAAPFGFVWAGVPAGAYTVLARAFDNRGAPRTTASATITVAPMALVVQAPAAGAVINADFVTVSGTFTAPPNAGLVVNGVRAQVVGNNFVVPEVPLEEGANELRVSLITPDEQTLSVTRSVMRAGRAPIRVYLEPATGLAPLTATLRVEKREDITIAAMQWEDLLSATYGAAGAGQETLGTLTLASPGRSLPTIVITDTNGNTYRQPLGIVAQDRNAIDQTLKGLWADYTALLVAGRVDLALARLPLVTATRYKPVLEPLGPHFATIVPSWSPLKTGRLTDEISEFTVARTIEGQNRLYFIYFVKDDRGLWKLDAM